jgi:Protein of unknown function (DUF3160)
MQHRFEPRSFLEKREIDFTLFKPRGHYAKSAALRQYFRTVSWLGEIDMVIAGVMLGSVEVLNIFSVFRSLIFYDMLTINAGWI